MRDGQILEGFQRITDAIKLDLAQVTRANAMLRTRLDALEGVLMGSRFALMKLALLQLISPKWAARAIQVRHSDEIEKFNRQRKFAAAQRAKVMNPPTQGLISVV